jgi:hypothetical protein
MGEEEAVVFKLDAGSSSQQINVASGPVVVALAESGGMSGVPTLGIHSTS